MKKVNAFGRFIGLALLLLPVLGFTIKDDGVQFYTGTYKIALNLAKKENKILFVDVYASWCGPCKMLKSKSFPNKELGEYYNSHFINIAVDGEEDEGMALIEKYNIKGYPTMLFVSSDGKLIYQVTGYRTHSELMTIGEKVFESYKK